MMIRKPLLIGITLVLLLAVVGIIAAQATPGSAIDWFAITAGGGQAAGSNVTLDSAVGQPIVGSSAGGNVSLGAGYLYAQEPVKLFLPMIRK